MTEQKINEWAAKLEPLLEQVAAFYEALSPEQKMWAGIGFVLAILVSIGLLVTVFVMTVKGLNNLLRGRDEPYRDWKPIRWFTCLWSGIALWAFYGAHSLRSSETTGWTLLLAAGVITAGGLIWFVVHRVGLLRGGAALLVTSSFGAVLAPVLYLLGIVAVIVAIIFLLIAGWLHVESRTVYVRSR